MCLGLIGEIAAIEGEGNERVARLSGVERPVSLITLPEAEVGDTISVHAGFAIAIMPPPEDL